MAGRRRARLDLALAAVIGARFGTGASAVRPVPIRAEPHGNSPRVAEHICTDAAVIAYRQDVLDDLWRHPVLADRLEALLPDISALDAYRSSVDRQRSTLEDVTWRPGGAGAIGDLRLRPQRSVV